VTSNALGSFLLPPFTRGSLNGCSIPTRFPCPVSKVSAVFAVFAAENSYRRLFNYYLPQKPHPPVAVIPSLPRDLLALLVAAMKPCFIVGFSLFLIVILSGGRQAAVEESNPFAFTAHPAPRRS